MPKKLTPTNSPHLPYCHACPNNGRGRIADSGPSTADILFIGDAPALDDFRRRETLSGRAGKELTFQYLPLAGLQRFDVCVTNVVKCGSGTTDDIPAKRLEACADKYLYDQINRMQPKLIVPMSSAACRVFIPGIDLELDYARPIETRWGKWSGTVFPIYHPNAGLGMTENISLVRECFEQLGKFLSGKQAVPVDEYPEPEYVLLEDEDEFSDYLWSVYTGKDFDRVAFDTEYVPTRPTVIPHCYSFSVTPGTGCVVMAGNLNLSRRINDWLESNNFRIILHNAVADLDPLEAMGITFPTTSPHRITDTMSQLFIRSLPNSLKVAAYRLLGMSMTPFMDLAVTHSKPAAVKYLELVASGIFPSPYPPGSRVQPIHKKAASIIKSVDKDSGFDPWKKWANIDPLESGPVTRVLGPMPAPNVSHFPPNILTHYAGRDPDATLRLNLLLEQNRGFENSVPKLQRV